MANNSDWECSTDWESKANFNQDDPGLKLEGEIGARKVRKFGHWDFYKVRNNQHKKELRQKPKEKSVPGIFQESSEPVWLV